MTARSILAIDAGQTGIKLRLRSPSITEDAVLPGIRTHEALLPQLAAAVRHALAQWRPGQGVIAAAGVSGLTSREADASALLPFVRDAGIDRVVLAHDSTTSYLGAMGPARGAVVAAGTGVVTLAVGPESVARVDGWGNVMGDAGSGYWIGREALEAVMRAYDGRGPGTALQDLAAARWPELSEAYIDLQSSAERVSVVASFAEAAARLAEEGDAVSRTILVRAGDELALSVSTALRRVGDTDEPAVCTIGGVFGSRLLRAEFEASLRSAVPGARFVEPRGQGIDGALALAQLEPQHPLASFVSAAGS
nr:BadF/BadG/BcrA/BcrD ATPase family protein [Microbacterium flavescens]